MKCQQCKGSPYGVYRNIRVGSRLEEHYMVCPQPGCAQGVVDRDVYYKTWSMNVQIHKTHSLPCM